MSAMDHLGEMLVAGLRRTGDGAALRYKQFGLWHPVSGNEASARANVIAQGLRGLGVQPGENVGIYGGNCLEWLLADLGILLAGGVSYGLDGFADAEELARALREVNVRFLLVEGEARMRASVAARASCPALAEVILLRRDRRAPAEQANIRAVNDLTEGASPAALPHPLGAEAAIVVPTSGTTGPSRAIVLPHGAVCAQISRAAETMKLRPGEERLSLLPIHHVAERVTGIYAGIASGVVINFPESADTALTDLVELQPAIVQLVPRMWRAMRSGIALTLAETTPLQRRAVESALRHPSGIKDRLVLKPLRRRLGIDGARLCLSTGGAMHQQDAGWFAALGREISDVYALTETAGAVAIGPSRGPKTLMTPLNGIELAADDSREIRVRAADLSHSVLGVTEGLPAGWFSTGDRRTVEGGGGGRMADALHGVGSVTHPFEREQALLDSPYVADAFVTSAGDENLRAIILLDADQTARYAQNAAVPFTHFRSLTEAAEIRALAEGIVAQTNRRFPEPPITSFHLLDRVLAPGDAELGPTMSLRRYRINAIEPAQTGKPEHSEQEGRTA